MIFEYKARPLMARVQYTETHVHIGWFVVYAPIVPKL